MKSTAARGLGYRHQKRRLELLAHHDDGSACYWCGLPMWIDPERNWDEAPLEADHIIPRTIEHGMADRLLHQWCNRKRGDGQADAWRPAVTGEPMQRRITVTTMPKVLPGTPAPQTPSPVSSRCEICGAPFKPNHGVRTCSRTCGAELRRRNRANQTPA